MKFGISPVEVSDLVPFSPSLSSTSKTCKPSFSGISKNGLWMWIVCDTTINLYHTENSEWLGGYCFGESLTNPSAKITAVIEFCSTHISFPCLLIAVDQDHESLICMYDINISKVVRAVLVPDLVRSLEVISGNGGACMDTLHLFMQLRYMFGIVAVGTSTGHMYFLDLCLDEDFECNENLPNITFVIKKYELLPERREKAISKQQHIFMLLNDQSVRNGSFEFESRSSSLAHFPYGKVHVTALKYIQSTVSLAMGFNFGGIQLWDLQNLCLLYTVANQPRELPIIAFGFQEPENDPRHVCYLWIIRGYSATDRPEDFSTATMYSLIYDKRTFVESFGYLYSDLRNCIKRFEYHMTSDPFSIAQSSSTSGSCLLSCQTVCQTDESHLNVLSSNDSDTTTENMSLCFLSWIVWSSVENAPTSYHLALFDLNQWYRAEMPSSNRRCDSSDLNPYFAHFTLEEVAQIFDLEPLLGVYAIPHSIKKFKYITPSEEFFFPSSLDFKTLMYSTNGICKTTFMGFQKRLLYEIADMGPNALVNPKEFYSDLIRCGLIADMHSTSERVPLIVQRETLLQLALEYHMPFFFMKCLKEWRYADSIQEGCTSRALLNWAWKKVIYIKSNIDKLSIPLFNCSGCDVDKAPLKCLYSYRRQLDLIDSIFMGYQKFATPRTDQGIQELKCRKDVVFSINTYLQVILWLRSVHVLPEVAEGEETDKNMIFPVNALFNTYVKRRNRLQKIHSSIGPTDVLLIDGLVKENFSENTWSEKGGNGIYPPPSVYAALSCYLLDDVPLELKHSLMYYLLLDICRTPQNIKNPLVNEVKKFPSVFTMSQSNTRLVKAFWYLDQFNFEVAIKHLLHPAVKAGDIQPWQHHRVIKSFLFQREAVKALKYINHMEPPENSIEDMKLHLSVLLARGAIIQAFDYQRSKQLMGFGAELLNHLFLGCQEMHKLKDLMYMPLNTLESSMLVKFLSENDDPRAQEALVMYYLLHCNFFEAAKVNEKLSMGVPGKSAASERTAGRDALVEGLLASVPKAEKNLVEEINRFPSVVIRNTEPLKPLSLSIKTAPLKQITYSDILSSLISEASSGMCVSHLESQTPLKANNRSFENIPFLRPPLTSEPTKISSEAFHSTPVTKRLLTSPTSEFSSPTKKSRLLDNAPFRSPLSKKKIPKHLASDVASLLQSPPIHRRNSRLTRDSFVKDSPASAPQGILKKKVESAKFPVSDVYTSKTPSVLSDAGSDSDEEGKDEMVVDEISDDIPGRQIRFSVPNKEDLNLTAVSNLDAQSPSFRSISSEPSSFMKNLEELKPLSLLEQFNSHHSEYMNISQRLSLRGLAREPLKAHSKELSKKQLLPEYEKPIESTEFSHYVSQQKLTRNSEQCLDTDSDICHTVESALEVESKKHDSNVAPVVSSSNSLLASQSSAEVRESNFQHVLSITRAESPLNRSGSSSGNSSYNSASDRSLIITPRKPLRDNSRNSSFSEVIAVQESKKEVAGHEVEMIIDDEEDICSVSDEDVSIIGEVAAPHLTQAAVSVPVQPAAEECSSSQDIFIINRPAVHSVETDNQIVLEQHSPEREECNIPENAFTYEETSVQQDCQNQDSDPEVNVMDVLAQGDQNQEKDPDVNVMDILAQADQNQNRDLEVSVMDVLAQGDQNQNRDLEVSVMDVLAQGDQNQNRDSEVNVVDIFASCDQNQNRDPEVNVMDVLAEDDQNQNRDLEVNVMDVLAEDDQNQNRDPEVSVMNVLAQGDQNQNRDPEVNVMNVLAQDDSLVQNFEEIIEDTSETQSSQKVKNNESDDINVSSKHFIDSVESQIDKSPEKLAAEVYDFTKDAPTSLPSYVPIKERIKSIQNVSELSKFDDDNDETYPSLLLQEQIELQQHPEVLESEESSIPEEYSLNIKSSVKPEGRVETLLESSYDMNTDSSSVECTPKTRAATETKDFSQKLSERFDFLSKNSDFYENKLHRETMNVLKESGLPQAFEFDAEKKSSIRKTRTFFFDKRGSTKTQISESDDSTSKASDRASSTREFLDSLNPLTYEQFSDTIQKGRPDGGEQRLKSSPNPNVSENSSVSVFGVCVSEARSRKKQESGKKGSTADRKQRSNIKKAKEKSKIKKMEFSFAEPHSPAGPEILEALTTPSQYPVGSFMFSPPLTRGRLRQKKMDDTLGSSFASVASETSFTKTKKPPVDPILEEIMAEKAPELLDTPSKSRIKSSRKKTVGKKKADVSHTDIPDSSINMSKVVDSPDLNTSKNLSSMKPPPSHNMILRQSKEKRSAKFF